MASLSSCWLIVENYLLAEGYEKWHCLRFFVHPFFIVICQLFLLAKLVQNWLSILTTSIYTLVCCILHLIQRSLRYLKCFFFVKSYFDDVSNIPSDDSGVKLENEYEQNCDLVSYKNDLKDEDEDWEDSLEFQELFEAEEDHINPFEAEEHEQQNSIFHFDLEKLRRECSDLLNQDNQQQNEQEPTLWNEEEQPSDDPNCSDVSNLDRNSETVDESKESRAEKSHKEDHELSTTSCRVEFDFKEEKAEKKNKSEGTTDLFYNRYCDKMWWFDQLNAERRCAVSAILNKKLGNASLLESIVPMDFNLLELANKEIAKSLKSDFEVVYVAQTSLCWEALEHQHQKVESISWDEQKVRFQTSVSAKFQQFQILLEKFVENERGEGKRFWNYGHTRSTIRDLLQVPEISGYMQNTEGGGNERETISAGQLLEIVDKAIIAFWNFLQTDGKKSRRMLQKLLSFDSQVEDPRDLQLLYILTRELNKKKNGLKEIKKRNHRPKRTNPMEDYQTTEIFFSMIDIKIISRVLKMDVITTEQLNWCQEKLTNILIGEGRILRTFRGRLFPNS